MAEVFPVNVSGYWGVEAGASERDALAIRNGDVGTTGTVRWDALPRRSFSAREVAKAQVHAGDIILTTSGNCGNVAFISEEPNQPTVATNFVRILRTDPAKVYPPYAFHYLRSRSFDAAIEPFVRGATIKNLSVRSAFAAVGVPVPGLEEQRRIATILDHADALQAKRGRVLQRLNYLASSIFRDTFGAPVSWPGRWPMTTIGDLAVAVTYGTSSKAGESGEWPILRMGNVTDDGRLDLTDLKYLDLDPKDVPKYTVRPGDMLFNRTNSKEKVGKTAVVRTDRPLALAGYLIRVRFDDAPTAEYVSAYMTSAHGVKVRRKLAKAAVNQANINATEMQNIVIASPPADLRAAFADRILGVEHRRASVLRAIMTGDELFASLQSRAFRGEL